MTGQAYVLLEDGERFDGIACGAPGASTGEVVFTTSMSGYQEAVTDPSYRGQVLVFTYPHIGNYGVRAAAMESDDVHVRGVVMRDGIDRTGSCEAEEGWLSWLTDRGVPAISQVDTRALVRHVRAAGSMRGGIYPQSTPVDEALERIHAEPHMAGRDLVREVSVDSVVMFDGSAEDDPLPGAPADGPLIAAVDTGVKRSILRELRSRGARVRLHPCSDDPTALLAGSPDAVFLANGPGDPAALDGVTDTVRQVIGRVPVFGICMGHQLLCRAVGLDTFKLPFGHRGSNHPVRHLASGRIDITSQNHGFAVAGPGGVQRIERDQPVRWDTDVGVADLSHVNLYDRTVEGIVLRDVAAATAQYHPEASPGPHDAMHLFDEFLELAR